MTRLRALNAQANAIRAAWRATGSLDERRRLSAELDAVYVEIALLLDQPEPGMSAAVFGATFSATGQR